MSTLDEFFDEEEVELPERHTLYDPNLNPQYGTGIHKLNMERRRIVESSELAGHEKKRLCGFDKALRDENNRLNNRKAVTRSLYLCHARLLQKNSGLFLDVVDEDDLGEEQLNELLEWVQNQKFANNYIHKLLITIKTYGELCGDESVQYRFEPIKPGKFRDDNQAPNPSNVLTWKDALNMAQTRNALRDRALILTEWGSACRPESELWELKYKHLDWAGDHYKLTVPWNGKTGERTIRLYPGAATLRRWIEHEHPVHDDPDDSLGPETYIWTKLRKNERMTYAMISHIFNEAGEDAGINKDYNPRHFRRSRASYLAGKPTISEYELRGFCGWAMSSPAPAAYVTKFRKDMDRNIAMADGASTKSLEKVKVVAPVYCNHCDQLTERGQEHCVCCGAEVDEELHKKTFQLNDPETEGKGLFQIIKEKNINGDDIESLQKLRPLIKLEGDRLWDDIEMLKGAVDNLDRENCVTGPGSYGAQLSAAMATAAGSASESWVRAKHTAMSLHPDFEYYPQMPRKRFVTMVTVLAAATLAFLGSMYVDGSLHALAAGDPIEWAALLTAGVISKWLFDREFPTVEEARAARREQQDEDK